MRKVLRFILLVLNLIAALLLLLSTLAGFQPPSEFILFSMLSYGYFILLNINIAFILFWLLFKRWTFLISLAAIVLRYSFVPLFFQIGGAADVSDNATIKVMSFNAHHYNGRNMTSESERGELTDSNAVAFLRLLRENDPDVLCLQEYLPYTDGKKVHLADSMIAMGYRYHVSAYPSMGYSATICWSKYPLVNPVYIDSSSKLQVDVVMPDDTLRVFSLHLHSYKLDSSDLKEIDRISHGTVDRDSARGTLGKLKNAIIAHEEEWDLLKPLIELSPYPTIVAGDFNDTPGSYIYQQMCELLSDSYVERGKGFCTTYHGFFPNFRIDYILHSKEMNALSYKRVKCNISDHYPIFVELEF